jgi:lysophospholipid acyltransferase (LPLAT)-like uncharacterized protein
VSETNAGPFNYAPLADYPLKDRIMIRIADLCFFVFIKAIGASVRIEVEGWENFHAIAEAEKVPIYCFWHDRIFLSTYYWRKRGIVVLTSRSKDGEYIARFIQRFGYGAIRGSSTRGGSKALVEMIRSMRSGNPMAFTVDGPKGPRYEVKPGAILLAKKTGNPIMPFIIEPLNYWSVRSWDRLQIPRPFTRTRVFIGKPIYVASDADDNEIEAKLNEFQLALDSLVENGRQWRASRSG